MVNLMQRVGVRLAGGRSEEFRRGWIAARRKADNEFGSYADGFKTALSTVDQQARVLTEESLSTSVTPERLGEINTELAGLIDQKIELQTALSRAKKGLSDARPDRVEYELSTHAVPDNAKHQQRMDVFTLAIAALLVGALFLITFLGIFREMTGEEVAQAAAPISGLAGIAVGFLFSDRRGRSDD